MRTYMAGSPALANGFGCAAIPRRVRFSQRVREAHAMDVLEAIRTRRSVGKVGPERPPRELIEQLLEAATAAPNHHLTEPWRLIVLAGRTREELGGGTARAVGRPNPPGMGPPQAPGPARAAPAQPPRAPGLVPGGA